MSITRKNVFSVIETVMKDPSASYWLRDALKSALQRDPVDAANDAEFLALVLQARCEALLNINRGGSHEPTK